MKVYISLPPSYLGYDITADLRKEHRPLGRIKGNFQIEMNGRSLEDRSVLMRIKGRGVVISAD